MIIHRQTEHIINKHTHLVLWKLHFIWKSPKFCFIFFFLSFKQNRICRDDAVNILNQWIESPSYSGHPLCTSLLDRAWFIYTEHWSTAPPFITLLDLQLDTTKPIPIPTATCVSHSHLHPQTHTQLFSSRMAWKWRRLCTFRLKRQPYNCQM